MTKQNILKSVVIILSMAIVLCTYLIFVKILNRKIAKSPQNQQTEINIGIEQNAKIKQFWVENEKIYILTTTPQNDKIIIIDEKLAEEKLTINLNKGDNKDE